MVEELLHQLDNPLQKIISPGNTVVIKPNLVKDFHSFGEQGVFSMITHGSILRPIIDHIFKALQGQGKIIICDTPLEKTHFEEVVKISGISEMVRYLKEEKQYPLELFDLRKYKTYPLPGDRYKNVALPGDPCG